MQFCLVERIAVTQMLGSVHEHCIVGYINYKNLRRRLSVYEFSTLALQYTTKSLNLNYNECVKDMPL